MCSGYTDRTAGYNRRNTQTPVYHVVCPSHSLGCGMCVARAQAARAADALRVQHPLTLLEAAAVGALVLVQQHSLAVAVTHDAEGLVVAPRDDDPRLARCEGDLPTPAPRCRRDALLLAVALRDRLALADDRDVLRAHLPAAALADVEPHAVPGGEVVVVIDVALVHEKVLLAPPRDEAGPPLGVPRLHHSDHAVVAVVVAVAVAVAAAAAAAGVVGALAIRAGVRRVSAVAAHVRACVRYSDLPKLRPASPDRGAFNM
eukprot:gene3249-biopygen12728